METRAAPTPVPGRALGNIPEAAWQEACRREAVVRPLAATPRLSRGCVIDACAKLGIGKSQLYELLRRYRADPRTTSLVPETGGAPKGTDRLAPQAAAVTLPLGMRQRFPIRSITSMLPLNREIVVWNANLVDVLPLI